MSDKTNAHSSMERANTVNIRPGVSVLSVLRHLNYKPWFALAEFVDNAVESYTMNQATLKGMHGEDFKLKVKIDLTTYAPTCISIKDNAAGITRDAFPRAFRPAELPENRTGLSEFGMGMKSAACWFSSKWSVRTKALNEPVERTVSFDVNQIVHDQLEELEIEEQSSVADQHFTEVLLHEPHHVPVGRTIAKIKEHLTDIYRVLIREGVLELYFDGDLLIYDEPSVLYVPPVYSPESTPLQWRKKIHFDFGDGLSVTGFAALRESGSFQKSGFALFRRNRLIQGSADEGYKPKMIFGQPQSYRSLRLYGELHLDGFEVSHTKDGFRWDDNETPFLELLKEHLDGGDLPLLRQAEGYRARADQGKLKKLANQAIRKTVGTMNDTLAEVLPQVAEEPLLETRTEALDAADTLATKELQISFRNKDWLIKIELANDPAESQWLSISDQSPGDECPEVLEIRVSLAHPFMENYAQTDSEHMDALLRVAAALALAEKLARGSGVKLAGTIIRNLNEILRKALSKPYVGANKGRG